MPSGPTRLCVTNAKGGTGKTTIAINVAGALDQRGRDVLFVDLDPQGNATEGLGFADAYDATPPTLFDVLTDHRRRDAVADLVVEHPEMDVVPASVDLLRAEQELTIAELMGRLADRPDQDAGLEALAELALNVEPAGLLDRPAIGCLDAALEAVEADYDHVIVDSPPFYGKLTDAAIYATRRVLVPALTEATSERAIELLIDQIAALEAAADVQVETVGVVANRIETTNEDGEMLRWLSAVFEGFPVWEVRKRVALQRAFSAGESLFRYDETVDVADVFRDIAAEIDANHGTMEVPA